MDTTIAPLRAPAPEETGPPKAWFLDEEWFQRDVGAVFRPRWLLAGHITEIAEVGQCLTYSLGADEALIRRDEGGEVRAYHNVCAHRGTRLCRRRTAKMSGRRIVCPYHGWSYSPADGSLLTAPAMHDDFDRSPWGLRPVHVDVWCGLIFVCFAEDRPRAIAEYMGDDALGGYDHARLKVAATKSHEIKANWKIVIENNLECYHCVLNHPELITSLDWRDAATDDFEGVVAARAAGFEVQRNESEWPMTLNGERACRVPLPRQDQSAELSTYHLKWEPGVALVLARDHGYIFSPKPLGPRRTELRQYWLVAADATEGTDYELDSLRHYLDTTMQQDRELCETVQEGMRMPAYTPGPLNRIHQSGQAGFYAWYSEQIRRRFPDEMPTPARSGTGSNTDTAA